MVNQFGAGVSRDKAKWLSILYGKLSHHFLKCSGMGDVFFVEYLTRTFGGLNELVHEKIKPFKFLMSLFYCL